MPSMKPVTGQENTYQSSILGLSLMTGTAAAVGTVSLPLPSGSQHFISKAATPKVIIAGLDSETIALTGSYDGTNFSAALIPNVSTTGQFAASADLGNATYIFPTNWNFAHYKFVKSATTDTVIVAMGYNTAPK